ncbi:MAG: Type II secretion system protein F [Parcubacteria group bacterium ADurb.Bin326]|nr:MAG: Type II secretion system protein F [Parcubacteria group bacterium ADurb.Bin326]
MQNNLAVIEVGERLDDYRSFLKNISFLNKVKSKELVVFFRQMAVMIDANIPIVRGLRILSQQTESDYLKEIITEVANEVEGGQSLSSAMSMFPNTFSDFYVNIIMSGETSGRLSEVMNYVADQKEKDYDLESKIRGAMVYPSFIVSVLLVVGFIIIAFVIPNLAKVLSESGAQLPWITRALLSLSGFVSMFWWLVLLLFFGAIAAWLAFIKTPQGEHIKDSLKINIPVFGKIWRHIYIVRICRSFATLVRGGVPISQSLSVIKGVVGNVVFEEIIQDAIKSVDEGNQISESLASNKNIPIIVVQMISVGEDSGKLKEVLEKSADFYSREIDNTVRNLSNLIEPVIMIVLGLAVGLFVAAVILPMWQLSASF